MPSKKFTHLCRRNDRTWSIPSDRCTSDVRGKPNVCWRGYSVSHTCRSPCVCFGVEIACCACAVFGLGIDFHAQRAGGKCVGDVFIDFIYFDKVHPRAERELNNWSHFLIGWNEMKTKIDLEVYKILSKRQTWKNNFQTFFYVQGKKYQFPLQHTKWEHYIYKWF